MQYKPLVAGLVALALWGMLRDTLPEAASAALIAIAIVAIGFGAIASQPAAQPRTRRRRKLSASQRAKRAARKALDRSNNDG